MNLSQVYYLIFTFLQKYRLNPMRYLKFIWLAFDNSLFNKYPILKLLFGIFIMNFIYKTFLYFIFLIIKSVFPVIYIYFILYFMNKNSDDKPMNQLLNRIKKPDVEENVIEVLEEDIDKMLENVYVYNDDQYFEEV